MRKIEVNMINAILAGKNWRQDNTSYENGVVKLHGNAIARKVDGMWQFTLAGWNTPTTRSRVSAILNNLTRSANGVKTRKGLAYISYRNGEKHDIDSTDWHNVR